MCKLIKMKVHLLKKIMLCGIKKNRTRSKYKKNNMLIITNYLYMINIFVVKI